MRGPRADKTFGGQSRFVLPVAGRAGAFIFMADLWKGDGNLIDSRYFWLPIQFDRENLVISWHDQWDLSWLGKPQPLLPSAAGPTP
jgi:hypothetical protein